jgi:hypothetical protein
LEKLSKTLTRTVVLDVLVLGREVVSVVTVVSPYYLTRPSTSAPPTSRRSPSRRPRW